jgi:type II secretory pathway component PulK
VRLRERKHRGYVLVLTLAVLVLVAGALVSSGQLAVRRAASAREAQRELQRRVGIASIRRAILPQAEQILAGQEARRGAPMAQHRAAVRLGDITFDLVIADEQAKANLNAMLARASRDVVENRLREALAGTGLAASLALRPVIEADRVTVSGPGQIFDNVEPQSLIRSRFGQVAPMETISCWGDGAVNVRRAPELVLNLALDPPWTRMEVGRLVQARRDMFEANGKRSITVTPAAPQPKDPLARLLQTAQIRWGAAGLTLQSTCHSLWIVTRDGRREWYDLAVEDAPDPQHRSPRVATYSW